MQIHILNSLATWRLTQMLNSETGERGPFAILDRAREYVQDKKFEISRDAIHQYERARDIPEYSFWGELSEALYCKFCLSVWIGITIALVTRQNILYGFAYSAASLLFGRIFERLDNG